MIELVWIGIILIPISIKDYNIKRVENESIISILVMLLIYKLGYQMLFLGFNGYLIFQVIVLVGAGAIMIRKFNHNVSDKDKLGLGYGDLYIVIILVGLLEWKLVVSIVFLAFAMAAFVGVTFMIFKRWKLKHELPLIPFLNVSIFLLTLILLVER